MNSNVVKFTSRDNLDIPSKSEAARLVGARFGFPIDPDSITSYTLTVRPDGPLDGPAEWAIQLAVSGGEFAHAVFYAAAVAEAELVKVREPEEDEPC